MYKSLFFLLSVKGAFALSSTIGTSTNTSKEGWFFDHAKQYVDPYFGDNYISDGRGDALPDALRSQ